MVKNTHERVVFKLWVVLMLISAAYGAMGAHSCSLLNKIEIHHKTYFNVYLRLIYRTYSGIFYEIINGGVQRCCPTASVEFSPIREKEKSIEEILVATVKADRKAPEDGIVKLFLPEFADKVALDVYDSSTPFLRLTRSPGHAIVMVKPPPKEPVFVGEIVVKSWAILIFLVTFAWVIGIFAWATVS